MKRGTKVVSNYVSNLIICIIYIKNLYYLYQILTAILKFQNYVVDDRKLTTIKLTYSENSRIALFLFCRKRKEAKNKRRRWRRTGKRRKGKIRDLVPEKVSTFAMMLSVVDNASAVRECLCFFFFFCGEILLASVEHCTRLLKTQPQLNS